MCACTTPVRTGIGAVCVEYGRPTWPITMLNHTDKHPWYNYPCFLKTAQAWLKNGLIVNTRSRAWLDQLLTNYSKNSTRRLR